ncbi:MAG: aspartate aminotransferase family protein [Gammaproteobacteria bacterium]|nr:aspartate aminotransferase family protein [Gammaproteobacteria bacterium]
MSHVFPRFANQNSPTVARGQGCYLYDTNGKEYLDGSGGAAVSCLGHGDAEVNAAIEAQLKAVAFAHTGFFTNQPAEQLADLLVEHAPGNLDRVYFVSGGSEAVEASIKLARQYFLEIGQPNRRKVIARLQSYHGNTLGALAAGGNLLRREPFAPLMIDTSHISPCYPYRGLKEGESELEYGHRVADELETEILRLGADQVMAFMAEPVVGATMGAVPAVEGYFKRIREICDRYGILLILDEVMCGMGRTGHLFSHEKDDINADIVTIAKGLGAGYQPIGAMICTEQIYSAVEQGSGFFQHGHTYVGHPVACAAGRAVVQAILNRGLLNNVNEQGKKLQRALHGKFDEHPHIGDIRGRGLFVGVELVRDKEDKSTFDSSLSVHKRFKKMAFEAGLICYPMGGTIDGRQGDHVLLAPPFIISDDQIDELVDKFSISMQSVMASLG